MDHESWIILAGTSLWFTGTVGGIWYGHRRARQPTRAEIAHFMNRVVNQEEMEEHERITKYRMAKSGRKTQRFDSGPNATIRKMPVRRVSRRFRGPEA